MKIEYKILDVFKDLRVGSLAPEFVRFDIFIDGQFEGSLSGACSASVLRKIVKGEAHEITS